MNTITYQNRVYRPDGDGWWRTASGDAAISDTKAAELLRASSSTPSPSVTRATAPAAPPPPPARSRDPNDLSDLLRRVVAKANNDSAAPEKGDLSDLVAKVEARAR